MVEEGRSGKRVKFHLYGVVTLFQATPPNIQGLPCI